MSNKLKVINIIEDSIDTVNSYRGNLHSYDSYVVIPHINLGVSDHPLNDSPSLKYINFCYLLFEGVSSINDTNKVVAKLISEEIRLEQKYYYVGGINIESNEGDKEFEIECSRAYLVLKEDSKITSTMWIPIETPRFKPNLLPEDVSAFFSKNPIDILNFIRE